MEGGATMQNLNIGAIFFGILFILGGTLFAAGKIHTRLNIWKQLPEEEKEKINIVPLCRNIGEVILLSGILILIDGLWPDFQEHWFSGAMVAWLIVAGLYVWFILKSNRYKTP